MKGRNKSKKRTTDTHHYWFPKKLYGHNRLMTLSYEFHHNMHNFFMRYCKTPTGRDCHNGFCQFQEICCYQGTTTPYGKELR